MPRKRPLFSASSRRLATTRRRFLQGSTAALAGMALANCRSQVADVQGNNETTTASEGGTPPVEGDRTLHVYTWADYVDEPMMAAFTEATGIEVVVDIYDSNETMLAKLQAGGGDVYSVLYPSDYMVTQMIDMDMLLELDPARLKGMENLLDKWQDPVYDPNNGHSIPYSWGTTGLLYNRELVSGTPEDWNYLWEYQEDLSRRLTLLEDVRETMGAVLKSLGYSYNTTDPAKLEEAYNKLMELKPHLASFKSFGFEDQLLGGDLTMVMSYSVDAIAATLADERMEYIVPASGSSVWTDTMVIPASAPDVDAAYQWLNFVLRPEVSQGLVERLYFATPIQPAYEMLSEDLKTNKDLFPSEDLIAKCEGIAPIGEAIDLYDQYWTQVTSA